MVSMTIPTTIPTTLRTPMDTAVALVQAYLRVNGYFTVAEFPIVEGARGGGYRSATDVDILAVRFPRARHLVAGAGHAAHRDRDPFGVDPALGIPADEPDMIVGEVKEGTATLNDAATDPAVLRAVLARFGCCPPEHAAHAAERLLRRGHVVLENGHHLRLLAFGSVVPPGAERAETPYRCVSLGHVIAYLEQYLRDHWAVLRAEGTKDPALGALLVREKARRGAVDTLDTFTLPPAPEPAPGPAGAPAPEAQAT